MLRFDARSASLFKAKICGKYDGGGNGSPLVEILI